MGRETRLKLAKLWKEDPVKYPLGEIYKDELIGEEEEVKEKEVKEKKPKKRLFGRGKK